MIAVAGLMVIASPAYARMIMMDGVGIAGMNGTKHYRFEHPHYVVYRPAGVLLLWAAGSPHYPQPVYPVPGYSLNFLVR